MRWWYSLVPPERAESRSDERAQARPARRPRCFFPEGGIKETRELRRCWVKSCNERNPYLQLPPGKAEHSEETAADKAEEGGDDVKSSWPLCLGLHTCYNAYYKGLPTREGEPIPKK